MLGLLGKVARFGGIGGAVIAAGVAAYDVRGQSWTGVDRDAAEATIAKECSGVLKTVFYGTNRSVKKLKRGKKGDRYRISHANAERLHVGSLEVCLPSGLEDPENKGRYDFDTANRLQNDLGLNNTDRDNMITIATIRPATHDKSKEPDGICVAPDAADTPLKASGDFCAEVRDEMADKGDAVVLFVHGYNVRFDSAAARAAQLSQNIGFQGATMTYSWPSAASLLQYFRDGEEAEIAAFFLKEYIELIIEKIAPERLHIIAHSMGNRALIVALEELSEDIDVTPPNEAQPVDSVILAAADIDQRLFEFADDDLVGIVKHVTIYAANDDRALDQSRFWHGFERLGQIVGKGQQRRAYVYEEDNARKTASDINQTAAGDNAPRKPSVYTIDASCDTFKKDSSAQKYCKSTNEATENTDVLTRAREFGAGVMSQIRKGLPSGDNHDKAFVVTPFIQDITLVTRGRFDAIEDRELREARIVDGQLIYELPDGVWVDLDKSTDEVAGEVDQMPRVVIPPAPESEIAAEPMPAPVDEYATGSSWERREERFSALALQLRNIDAEVEMAFRAEIIKFKENAASIDEEYVDSIIAARDAFREAPSCPASTDDDDPLIRLMRLRIIFDTSADAAATARLAMRRRDAIVEFMAQNGVPVSRIKASLIGRDITPGEWENEEGSIVSLDKQGWAEISSYCSLIQ